MALQEKFDIDDFGDDALNERKAENAGPLAGYFQIKSFFGNVDDLVEGAQLFGALPRTPESAARLHF